MVGLVSPKHGIPVRVGTLPYLTKEQLVQKLISDKTLATPRIINAFKAIDRKDFVLSEDLERAYEDRPLSIGYAATISQPTTVAFMLEKLFEGNSVRGKDTLRAPYEIEARCGPSRFRSGRALAASNGASKILEIGTGSGYMTALLAKLAGVEGKVYSIEYVPELTEFAKINLDKYNFKNIKLFTGDGKLGLPEYALFDRVISSASAEEIPKTWKDQLRVGGKVVAPVGESLVELEKLSKRRFKETEYKGFVFVPLQ